MRREDQVAFITTFVIFALSIFSIGSFSDHVFSETSCMEKCRVSLQACTMQTCIKSEAKIMQKKVIKKTKPLVKKVQKPLLKKELQKPLQKEEKPLEKIVKNSQKAVSETRDAQVKKETTSAAVMDARARFFKKVKEEINSNKTYPRVALRRSIEGEVKILFTIFSDGSVKINRLTGDRFFQESSKNALLDTFPLQIPKELQLTFPLNLSVEVKYLLS